MKAPPKQPTPASDEPQTSVQTSQLSNFYNNMRDGLLKTRALINVIGHYETDGDLLKDGTDASTHGWATSVAADLVDTLLEELDRLPQCTDRQPEEAQP
jgi:hypothetical protein